jgi:hypothetical protein
MIVFADADQDAKRHAGAAVSWPSAERCFPVAVALARGYAATPDFSSGRTSLRVFLRKRRLPRSIASS